MAKLSAYNQTEVARYERERDLAVADSDFVSWERITYAFMSNGRVLEKRDVKFRDTGERHSYGWKKHHKKFSTEQERSDAFARLVKAGFNRVAAR